MPPRPAITATSISTAWPPLTRPCISTAPPRRRKTNGALRRFRSRPHREIHGAGRAHRLRQPCEIAKKRPRLAWIDDLFHPELFRGAERRAQLVQPLLDLRKFRLRVIRGIDLRAIRRF